VDGGVEMYVSEFNEFVVKRMPESGARHPPTCPSFELLPNERIGRLSAVILLEPRGEPISFKAPAREVLAFKAIAEERYLRRQNQVDYLGGWSPTCIGKRCAVSMR
jgi:hypothetical protein